MATTTHRFVLACSALLLSSSGLVAQADSPAKALQRAIVIEEQERDLEQAAKAYRAVLDDTKAAADARGEAAVRLGRVLQRLGRKEEARQVLTALAADGRASRWVQQAKELLASSSKDVEAIRQKAREVLASRSGRSYDQLLQLGPEAVPEIIAARQAKWRGGDQDFATMVWALGGSAARNYIAEAVARGDATEHRALLSAIHSDFADGMRESALALLRSPAAVDDSRVRALGYMRQRAPFDMLVQLAQNGEPSVVENAWSVIGSYLEPLNDEQREPLLAQCLPAFRAKLASLDLTDADAARSVLGRFGFGLHATRTLILESLPSWLTPKIVVRGWRVRPDEHYEDVLAAARSIGPNPKGSRGPAISSIATQCLPLWSSDKLDGIVELVKLGYLNSGWVEWARSHEVAVEDLLRAFDGDPSLVGMLNGFNPERLPADVLGSLTESWSAVGRETRSRLAMSFAHWVAATGHEQAGEWVDRIAGTARAKGEVATLALVKLLKVADRPDTRERIRRRVLDEKLTPAQRSYLFTELVGRGDAITCGWIVDGKAESLGLGVAWALRTLSTKRLDGGPAPLSEDQLLAAWRAGLEAGSHDYLTAAGDWLSGEKARADHPLWKGLMEAAMENSINIAKRAGVAKARTQRVAVVANLAFAMTGADAPISDQLEVLMGAMIQNPSKDLRGRVLGFLEKRAQLSTSWRKRILRLANSKEPANQQAKAVVGGKLVLTVEELEQLAADNSVEPREAYRVFLPALAAGQVDYIRRSLPKFRDAALVTACVYLERSLDPAAVPELLELLRSKRSAVREAARSALRAIRFHREQQDYWANDAGAISQSAAALQQLQKQAAPDQPKARRLLAIRSIAALRQPVALPALIEYSAESDVEIVAAAKAAIDALTSMQPGNRK